MYVCSDGKDGACTSDKDKAFEKSLNGLRGSSNADVARAAGAYGAAGAVNGASVGFADLSQRLVRMAKLHPASVLMRMAIFRRSPM